MNRNESPEEKAARKAKHERLMQFILREYFDKGTSIAGDDVYNCILCSESVIGDNEACNHYFENHKGQRRPQREGEVHYNEFERKKDFKQDRNFKKNKFRRERY